MIQLKNTYHNTIKKKPTDVKSSTYIDFIKESDEKTSKFKIDDIVVISKYKNIFARCYTPNRLQEIFVIKKVSNTVPQILINDLNDEEIVGDFFEKELQKTIQKEVRTEKLILKKGDKSYVK